MKDQPVLRFLVPATLLLFAVLLGGPTALAQSEEQLSKARQLYSQGVTQEAAGDWAGALSSFQQVARIKMTPQVRFHIARCKEHLGRLNEALGGYRMAEYEAEKSSDDTRELLTEIRKARGELKERIPKLTIVRGRGASAIKIELDGVALGQKQIGTEVNVDPGPHVVSGVLKNGQRFEANVELGERDSETVTLDVPEELQAAAGPVREDGDVTGEGSGATTPKPSKSSAPWVIGGLGLASLGASAVFFVLSENAKKKLDDECLGRTCPDTLEDTQKQGETYATLSGVTLGLGAVGVGVATIMLIGQSDSGAPKAQPGAALSVSVSPRSVRLQGHF